MAPPQIGLVGALIAAALVASPASVAEAAEVRLERLGRDCTRVSCPPDYGERLVVEGGRGEANRLSIARAASGEFQVTAAGAPLRAGSGCTLSGPELVACPTTTPLLAAFVYAGDRDDTVTSSVTINVDGGSGDDRLAGSELADALYGGKGRDVVNGNGGDDALQDGRLARLTPADLDEGRFFVTLADAVIPVPAERDVFDGGAGRDVFGYAGRRRGVFVDLARAARNAGARGERDTLRGLEVIVGAAARIGCLAMPTRMGSMAGTATTSSSDVRALMGSSSAAGRTARAAAPATTPSGSGEPTSGTSNGSRSPAVPVAISSTACSCTTSPRTIASPS